MDFLLSKTRRARVAPVRPIARLAAMTFVLLLFSWAAIAVPPDRKDDRPNIVLILADDIGIEGIGAYGADPPFRGATPNLDRLAKNGAMFTRCYNHGMCSPSRIALLTGLYNARNFVDWGMFDRQKGPPFPELLRNAGYATGIAGKWQLNMDPRSCGFSEAFLTILGNNFYWNSPRLRNGIYVDGTGRFGPDMDLDFLIRFIRNNASRSFLAFYSMALPHGPIERTPANPNKKPELVDLVRYMDRQIGRLVNELDNLGLRDNTLIIYVQDNGSEAPIPTFRGVPMQTVGKGRLTERGTRSALIANWKGTIEPGTRSDDLVAFYDFLPTILELARVPVYGHYPGDGISFVPQLLGTQGRKRNWLMLEMGSSRVVLDHKFKLDQNGALYDLSRAPNYEPRLPDAAIKGDALQAKEKFNRALKRLPPRRQDLSPFGPKLITE
jgi:arylsulfatase A